MIARRCQISICTTDPRGPARWVMARRRRLVRRGGLARRGRLAIPQEGDQPTPPKQMLRLRRPEGRPYEMATLACGIRCDARP